MFCQLNGGKREAANDSSFRDTGSPTVRRPECRGWSYFSCVEMLVKLVLRVEPIVFTVAMITTEMPAAIKPYSIAVGLNRSSERLELSTSDNSPVVSMHRLNTAILFMKNSNNLSKLRRDYFNFYRHCLRLAKPLRLHSSASLPTLSASARVDAAIQ